MTNRPRPPRQRPPRRYPLSAYLPFALLVAVPVVLVIVIVALIVHLLSPAPARRHSAPPAATATALTRAKATATARPVLVSPRRTPGITATATVTATATITGTPGVQTAPTAVSTRTPPRPVTVAVGVTAAGAPIGAATVFHHRPIKLWAFAVIPNARAGDPIRFVWHDLNQGIVVEDLPDHIRVSAALFHAHMFAYLGRAPTQPFAPGGYRIDVFHNGVLVASGGFSIAPS